MSALPLGWNALHMLCTYRMSRRPDGARLQFEDEDVFTHGEAGPHGWGAVESSGRPWLQLDQRPSKSKAKSSDGKSTRSKGSADKRDRAKRALLRAALRRRSP